MQMEGSRCPPFAFHEFPRDGVVFLHYRLNSKSLIDFLDHKKASVSYGMLLLGLK